MNKDYQLGWDHKQGIVRVKVDNSIYESTELTYKSKLLESELPVIIPVPRDNEFNTLREFVLSIKEFLPEKFHKNLEDHTRYVNRDGDLKYLHVKRDEVYLAGNASKGNVQGERYKRISLKTLRSDYQKFNKITLDQLLINLL